MPPLAPPSHWTGPHIPLQATLQRGSAFAAKAVAAHDVQKRERRADNSLVRTDIRARARGAADEFRRALTCWVDRSAAPITTTTPVTFIGIPLPFTDKNDS